MKNKLNLQFSDKKSFENLKTLKTLFCQPWFILTELF